MGQKRGVLPGFGLSLGYTVFYLSLIVLVPLATIFTKSATLGWGAFWSTITTPRVLASFHDFFGYLYVII